MGVTAFRGHQEGDTADAGRTQQKCAASPPRSPGRSGIPRRSGGSPRDDTHQRVLRCRAARSACTPASSRSRRTRDQLATVLGRGRSRAQHANERVSQQLVTGVLMEAAGQTLDPTLVVALGMGRSACCCPSAARRESEADLLGLDPHGRRGLRPAREHEVLKNMKPRAGKTPSSLDPPVGPRRAPRCCRVHRRRRPRTTRRSPRAPAEVLVRRCRRVDA